MKPLLIRCTFVFLLVRNFLLFAQQADPIPTHETLKLQSTVLSEERIITIWLPENYTESTERFPTLYMADGGIEEDFPHVANTISKLIQEQKIPPMILVGVQNTQRRRDLTSATMIERDKSIAPQVGGAANFRAFIAEELIPIIEKQYRTTNARSIIGESLAGLFVIETLLETPDLFDNYIAFDPSLWWNDSYLVKTANEKLTKNRNTSKRLWFASSNAKDIRVYTKKLAGSLKKMNPSNLEWNYVAEPKLKHATLFRATKEKALLWTFEKH